jgi:aminopeptidase N
MQKTLIIILIIFQQGHIHGRTLFDNYQYDIDLEYDSTKRQFSGDLRLSFSNLPDSVDKLPFQFLLDSTNANSISIWLNKNECEFELKNSEYDAFTGILVDIDSKVIHSGEIDLLIRFKSVEYGEYFNSNQVLLNGHWIPKLYYFGKNGFDFNFQKHSDYTVNLSYPSDFKIATSGLITSKEEENGLTQIHTLASSIPSYGLVMSKDFLVRDTISRDGVLIRSFYYENDAKWGTKLLEIAEDVIDFYIDTLGFYPQPVLNIIPGANKPYGGWPVSPNIVCVHRGIDTKGDYALTHATWITAHEIGHQYWGFNYVLEPLNYPQWFGISMGIYTDWLYSKSRKIEKNYYSFYKSYIKGLKKGYNTTVMQLTDSLNQQGFDWNNVIKHGKSFAILRMLAYEIGEDKFFEIFNDCLKSYKGVNVTLDMFQSVCESSTNKDLDWFFNQWYLTNDYLDFEVLETKTIKKAGGYETSFTIIRKGNALASTLDYQIILENGEIKSYNFNGQLIENKINLETKEPVKQIVLDPDKKYPLTNKRDWAVVN